MTQARDHLTIGTARVRHSTARRDWICPCGSKLATRFFADAPHWRTVCAHDESHDDQQFIHYSTYEYLQHRDQLDAAQAQDVFKHLPPELREREAGAGGGSGGGSTLRELEAMHIADAVRCHQGNRTAAARELGINPSTLHRKVRSLGIVLPEKDGRSG